MLTTHTPHEIPTRLEVRVRGRGVAHLYRERDEYVLKYLPQASEAEFVSLTMPVREEPWRWPRDLHPFFRQNLPEGFLLNIIREEFGPYLDGTDLSLLAVVGGFGIGRVTVVPEGIDGGGDLKPLDLEALLNTEIPGAEFARLVREYARAAISGAVPKILAPQEAEGAIATGKTTLRSAMHIVKGSDETTPFLGFNEFYSMRVLERLQVVPVAPTRMSADGRLLVVDRFDVDTSGTTTHGLEDACSLLGYPPHEKYRPSMEAVVSATREYIPAATRHAQLQQLGWLMLTNFVVRNADCHSKNIALYYRTLEDVAYSPAYDIVTTQAYPRYATNPPGLSLDGRKTWRPGNSLRKFFSARLGIGPSPYTKMVERVCEAAVETGREMIEAAKHEPRWHTITKQMLHAWNEGMAGLRSVRGERAHQGLTEDIERAGFSDPEPPERPTVIGKTARRGKR